ncbi:MAG: response regulator [Chryseosolibacter sp.]
MEKARYVLYVDDDPDDREIFGYALAKCSADISLTTAEDGYDALEKLTSLQQPCCIYLDINMPKMNGIQLLKILKSHRDFELIPVIIFSTSVDSRSKREAMDLGAVDVYRKPTSVQGLLEFLNASISTHAGRDARQASQ